MISVVVRPPADKCDVIRGIFWILDSGTKWKDLPREYGSKSTVHQWFKRWVHDGTFCKAIGSGDGIGRTKAGKCVKIMVLVEENGLPVAVDTASAAPPQEHARAGPV